MHGVCTNTVTGSKLKVDWFRGEKSLAAPGNQTCHVSICGVWLLGLTLYQLSFPASLSSRSVILAVVSPWRRISEADQSHLFYFRLEKVDWRAFTTRVFHITLRLFHLSRNIHHPPPPLSQSRLVKFSCPPPPPTTTTTTTTPHQLFHSPPELTPTPHPHPHELQTMILFAGNRKTATTLNNKLHQCHSLRSWWASLEA